jgi:hypothetical protein
MWNTKKPPSHSSSKTNPSPRNIVCLFLPFDCLMHFGSEIRSTTRRPSGAWPHRVAPAVGEMSVLPPAGPYFEELGARSLRNVAFVGKLSALLRCCRRSNFRNFREQWIVQVKADRRRPSRRAAPPPRAQTSRVAHVRVRFQPGLQSFGSFYPDPAAIAHDS